MAKHMPGEKEMEPGATHKVAIPSARPLTLAFSDLIDYYSATHPFCLVTYSPLMFLEQSNVSSF
jgi:hypothetical protein